MLKMFKGAQEKKKIMLTPIRILMINITIGTDLEVQLCLDLFVLFLLLSFFAARALERPTSPVSALLTLCSANKILLRYHL